MIAQVFAHGVREAFRKILKLSIAHQDKARTVRLRNKWVDVDPRTWDTEMDVSINVGLGRGTQEQKIVTARAIVESTLQLLQIQGGLAGPFVYPHHISEAFGKLYEVLGVKSAEPYIDDLSVDDTKQFMEMQQQQGPGLDEQELQLKREESQMRREESQGKMQLEFTKEQLKHIRELYTAGLTAEANEAKNQLDAFLGQAKIASDEYKAELQARNRSQGNGAGQ